MIRKKLHGIHVPHRKHTKDMAAVRMPCPDTVTIPMSMHIGAPAKPIVKAGDTVQVGQPIAEAAGPVSAPIHASVSGKVRKIDDMLASNGRRVQTVVIESDGLQTPWEGISAPTVTDLESFLNAVRSSGVVGLGGAGFPTGAKLTVNRPIDTIIVNGAECEPYITSDTRTMLDDTDLVMTGAKLLQQNLNVPKVIFGIEDNKPDCIRLLRQRCAAETGMEVQPLPAMYPQGGEKVLIFHTTGRIVPEGKLPLDVGTIVINCTTLAAIARYITTGIPLVEKCVTVDGSAVKEPKNVLVPIGTAINDVFTFCGGFREEPKKVLYGGPMMGIAVPDLQQPILKNTNAILALNEAEATPPEPTPCIKCGRCIAHCPLRLMPVEIESACTQDRMDELAALKVNLCMECGCCSYICPAHRPLVQTNKLAKAKLTAWQKKQQEVAAK